MHTQQVMILAGAKDCSVDEVAAYARFKTLKEDALEVLFWLKEHAIMFPIQALAAQDVIAVYASSERDFSSADPRTQTQHKPGTVFFLCMAA